jgi:uncharacterized protein (TIRG00374 family)
VLIRINPRLIGIWLTIACVALGAYAADWTQTVRVIARADLTLILLASGLLFLTFNLFALRWRRLIAVERALPLGQIFNFLMIGYLTNAILPARPGDLTRAILLRRSHGISLSVGIASVVLERLFDVLAICLLGVLVSLAAPLPTVVLSALYGFAAAGLGLIAVLLLFNWRHKSMAHLPDRFPALFNHRVARFLVEWLQRFALAIDVLYSPTRLTLSIALTALGWGTLALSMMVLLNAFHLPVPPAAALMVLVATSLGAAIPSSPASLGVYHFMAVIALSVWQIDTSTALAFAIGSHAIVIGLHISLGIAGAWIEGIGMTRLTRLGESEHPGDPIPARGI